MSQDVSTKPLEKQQSEPAVGDVSSQNWSVDAYADRLMDDLFQDVDHILEGGSRRSKGFAPDLVKLKTVQVPHIVLPSVMMPKQQEGETVDAKTTKAGDKRRKSRQSFDRLLLAAACGLLGVTLGLWLWNRGYLQQLWLQIAPEPQAAIAPPKTAEQLKAEADAEFIAYMERSLEILDRQFAGQPAEPVVAPNSALPIPPPAPPVNVTVNPNLTVPAPQVTVNAPHQGNLAEVLNRIAIALERGINPTLVQPNLTVTIPRTPPAPQTTAAAPASPAPAASPKPAPAPAPAPAASASPQPSPQPSQSPQPSPKPTTLTPQVASAPPPIPQPAPPTAAEPQDREPEVAEEPVASESAPSPAAAAPATTPSPATSGVTHKMVGILELGDRSAALFEIDGVARRVNIGESIGSSGWTLVEVTDGEAIVRRNGEVRSIYTGQSL